MEFGEADEVRRFEGWEIRPRERVLCVDGETVRLGSRAFDLLLALVRHAGRVVPKGELLDLAWPGRVVEENNLSVQISALRKRLGAGAIVNVAGIGYRLAARPLDPSPAGAATRAVPATPPHALVGRDADLARLLPQAGRVPLLSLVGTGGVGKTALARVLLAAAAAADWPDGVHWIDLTLLQPGQPLLPRVAHALGVLHESAEAVPREVLHALGPRRALIALDNCEHVLDAVVEGLAPLLRAAPGLRWLATSQAPLRLAGEEVYRLAPLEVAPPGLDAAQSAACSATALFLHRAQPPAGAGGWSDTALMQAAEIGRALDGLPLALEIAAARVATLGLAGVHEQLHRRLSLRSGRHDAPGRQHSLRDTYAWSHGLLAPHEQWLFRRLQPFQGGFTAILLQRLVALEASAGASAPSAVPDDVLDTLDSLLEKSLLHGMPPVAAGAAQRWRLLDSARDFALQQLSASGETETALRRHAQLVADELAPAWDDQMAMRDADWALRYLPERDNLEAALAWACRRDEPGLLARLVAVCALMDDFADTEARLPRMAVPLATLQQAPPALRGPACLGLGWIEFLHGSRERAHALLEQALRDHEACGDLPGTYLALIRLTRSYRLQPDRAAAARALWQRLSEIDATRVPLRLRLYAESTVVRHYLDDPSLERLRHTAEVARRSGFDTQAAICGTNLTDALLLQGRWEEVVDVARATLAQGGSVLSLLPYVSHNEAHALVRLGRFDEARAAGRRALRCAPNAAHMLVDLFALAAVRRSRWADAALMAGCAARARRDRGFKPDPAEAAVIAETQAALFAALGAAEAARLLDLGGAMAMADVLAMAGLTGS